MMGLVPLLEEVCVCVCVCVCVKLLQSCLILCHPTDSGLLCLWDSPGKNTGVGCKAPGFPLNPGMEPMSLMSPALAGLLTRATS